MTGRARGPAVALATLLAVISVVGCGVPLQEQAQPLPSGALPSAIPTPNVSPTSRETKIFFVLGRDLEGVAEPITDRSANGVMAALAAGPPIDRQAELRTLLLDPLTGVPMLVVTSVTPGGQVVLQRTDAYLLLPATDQVLLTGQVVHSMADVGLSEVMITDPMGAPMPVALPDGRVKEGAVTAEDYALLLTG